MKSFISSSVLLCIVFGCAQEDHHLTTVAEANERARMLGHSENYRGSIQHVTDVVRQLLGDEQMTISDERMLGEMSQLVASSSDAAVSQWKQLRFILNESSGGKTHVMVIATRTKPRHDAEQTALVNGFFDRLDQKLSAHVK